MNGAMMPIQFHTVAVDFVRTMYHRAGGQPYFVCLCVCVCVCRSHAHDMHTRSARIDFVNTAQARACSIRIRIHTDISRDKILTEAISIFISLDAGASERRERSLADRGRTAATT